MDLEAVKKYLVRYVLGAVIISSPSVLGALITYFTGNQTVSNACLHVLIVSLLWSIPFITFFFWIRESELEGKSLLLMLGTVLLFISNMGSFIIVYNHLNHHELYWGVVTFLMSVSFFLVLPALAGVLAGVMSIIMYLANE